MSERLDTALPSTLLFDHPSLRSVAASLSPDSISSPTRELALDAENAEMPRAKQMRSRSSQRVPAVVDIVSAVFLEIQGTAAALDAPIASTGMDSIAMTELATVLAERVDTELPQTLLFDHPTMRTVATFVATTAPSEATVDTATEETRGLVPSAAKRMAAEAT